MTKITDFSLNQELSGIRWSFREVAQNASSLCVRSSEIIHTPPTIIGHVNLADSNIIEFIRHNDLVIKLGNSFNAALPRSFHFLTDTAFGVTNDLFHFIGAERFYKSKISLIVQKHTVEPNTALREPFAQWHTHLGDKHASDIIYQLSNTLTTQFQDSDGHVVAAPENSVIRMGGGISHRSQTNNTPESIDRIWAAFLVYPPKTPDWGYGANNGGFSESNPLVDSRYRPEERSFTAQKPRLLFQ